MINVGAVSYLVKNASPSEMVETINEVSKKGFYYNDTVLEVIQDDIILSGNKSNKSAFDDEFLTSREREVLTLICQQLSTNEIAEKLFISSRTVEGHRTNLMLKTESKNIAGLVVYAIQNKLLLTDEL
jgi:DNA-binding NarL/FixJ family response regulator